MSPKRTHKRHTNPSEENFRKLLFVIHKTGKVVLMYFYVFPNTNFTKKKKMKHGIFTPFIKINCDNITYHFWLVDDNLRNNFFV